MLAHPTARVSSLWLFLLALCFLAPAAIRAADDSPAKPAEAASSLPLTKVVLFNSGVGFFEHRGDVEGDTHVDLKFNVHEINDLLKSMVLEDAGGGRISTVNYDSKDPITKTLKTFAIDLTTNPTLADLLRQIRGEKVEVDAPQPIAGTIVGVEQHTVKVGRDETTQVEFLNLMTADGLRSLSLENISRIKLSNKQLNGEFNQALGLLALGHATDKKTVTLHFTGDGKRPVRVGYIQEAPVWQTSYRLVLHDDKPPFLQGWAIVENPTEQDWNNVSLTLVSGRPISFVMDLYQPLYIPRPVVAPEQYASLNPQTYDQSMADKSKQFGEAGGRRALAMRQMAPQAAPAKAAYGAAGGFTRAESKDADQAGEALNMQQGVSSAAQGANVGELFQYKIDAPVTLRRQQSAMLPIVNDSIKGEKVSIYNPAVQAKHPLNGLKFVNSTKLHLMQGPITVFDGGVYAGDARIEDIAPGSERLISYALDLDTEVAPESKFHPEQLVSVRIVKGTLLTSRKYTRTQEYTVKNSGSHAKKVLIEYPLDPNWTLVSPKEPAEKTRQLYRFAVEAEPGKPAKLAVEEERTDQQQWALGNLDNGTIFMYQRANETSPKVKEALGEVIKRHQAIEQLVQKRAQAEGQVQAIDADQARIRQNMAVLDHAAEQYKDYVKEFGEQEKQLKDLRTQIQQLQADEAAARKSLDDYLMGLDLS